MTEMLSDSFAIARFGISVKEAHQKSICIKCRTPISLGGESGPEDEWNASFRWRKYGMCLSCGGAFEKELRELPDHD